MKHRAIVAAMTIMSITGMACTGSPMAPTAPSATTSGPLAASNPDGSTLKVTEPALVSPADNERVDSRRPTYVWLNASGENAAVGLAYELVVVDAQDKLIYTRPLGETPGAGTHTSELELAFDTQYFWRIRAVLGAEVGPWSIWGSFRTPVPPPPPTTTTPTTPTGTIGPARTMPFSEAYGIIVNIHNVGRFNLGASSTRDYRVAFLFGAVAAIHYGHARFNPQGPDTNWCVKDAGQGRPPSDDVLVRCSTREAWDLVSGAGANGYNFHADFIGVLPSIQNVYAPPRSALGNIPQ